MAELSELQKDQIISEERFRASVKAGLDAQKPEKPFTSWELLNSSLGLLLLSSVVISGFGAAFTYLKDRHEKALVQRAESLEQQKRIGRINDEIGYRTSVLLVLLAVASDDPKATVENGKLAKDHSEAEIKEALSSFIIGRSPAVPTLYVEFGNSSVLQLATELRKFEPRDEETPLARVISAMSAVALLPNETYRNPLKAAAIIQQETLQYQAWRDADFFFTNCPPEKPFC